MSALKLKDRVFLRAAFADGATARPLLDITAATDNPTPAIVAGTNVRRAVLTFTDGQASVACVDHLMPSDWHPADGLDIALLWNTAAVDPLQVRWTIESALTVPGDVAGTNASDDPAYNTLQPLVSVASSDATYPNVLAVLLDVALMLPDASDARRGLDQVLLSLRIGRTPAHADDTLGADANLIGVELRFMRAVTIKE